MAMVHSDFSCHGVVDNGRNGFTQGRREEASKLGPSWYFSRKEIEENSPSRRDGIDLKEESNLRKSYCKFLQELGKKLKLPPVTIATAMVFCHRFYLRQSLAKNDRRIIATVCMFLAAKVEETPIPLKDVILISYEFIHKKDPMAGQRIKQQKELFDKQKELILLGERVVLVTLEFDLNIHHAYKPLVEAIRRFNVGGINNFPQVAWSFVNDGLSSTLCLQFEPHHIAAGVIFLAAKFLKVKLPSDGDKVWWQEFDVTLQQLEDFSSQMLELYERNCTTQAQPSHGGETKGSSAGARNQCSSVNSEENSKEPSAHGHHNVSSLSNLQHSSSTGAPRHHELGHSNSDKHFSGHKMLQNDNGGSKVKNRSGTRLDACMDRLHHDKRSSSPGHHYSQASHESHSLAEEHKPHRSHDDSNETRHSVGDREAHGLSTFRMDVVHNKDKVKAEKQSKSKGGVVSTKLNVMDDKLLDRGLEHGVALAVEDEKVKQDKRQNLSHSSMPPADLQNTNQAMESGCHAKQGVPTTKDMGFPDSKEHPPPFHKQNDVPEHKAQQLDHLLKHQKGLDHSQIV